MTLTEEQMDALSNSVTPSLISVRSLIDEVRFLRRMGEGHRAMVGKFQSALNTEEIGEALLTVASDAHAAEQKLAAIMRVINEEG